MDLSFSAEELDFRDEVRGWLRKAGFSSIQGPFRSSPLSFDPDSILIAAKRGTLPRAR